MTRKNWAIFVNIPAEKCPLIFLKWYFLWNIFFREIFSVIFTRKIWVYVTQNLAHLQHDIPDNINIISNAQVSFSFAIMCRHQSFQGKVTQGSFPRKVPTQKFITRVMQVPPLLCVNVIYVLNMFPNVKQACVCIFMRDF